MDKSNTNKRTRHPQRRPSHTFLERGSLFPLPCTLRTITPIFTRPVMASVQSLTATQMIFPLPGSLQLGLSHACLLPFCKRRVPFLVKACSTPQTMAPPRQDAATRRQTLVLGALAASFSLINAASPSREQLIQCVGSLIMMDVLREHPWYGTVAAEALKGFQAVSDKNDGYSFLYPFGWQEVVIRGQDKVFKDVIEPLESVSVTMAPTSKQDIRDLGSPPEVAEALIKKVLAPPSQTTKLVEAKENTVDGKSYYTFEFVAQAPNYTRHALGSITIGNGKFYTLTTGANERRWAKMKDKLHTVVDSFKIFNEQSAYP
ncbi:psbP-like protein 1, chloroplastic isoform X1 [Amborella trichopoda]|uniref:psbP-like protein 1, chloroplastic isoform X1 n=1 Tax=Amborella trichopoda TaxID=13333 RepID=UPI0009C0A59D|nr:psbP-like protein 1, chloroplastic isoform X1 [Amborella trichopoda]XP_020522837.1 psbP-like protein 1, chloroplastic isoform X1 [Amborella trichopoda]|eukprot:XP_020522836.1 psbP-like protein 1, chloroplastic isoform X1 [Amborella trichopoda]